MTAILHRPPPMRATGKATLAALTATGEPATTAAMTAAAGDGGGGRDAAAVPGYQVLAGVHAVAARADAVARRLAQAGFDAQVVKLDDPGGPWFRVVVGGFDSLPRAREAAMQIRTEVGVDALVGPPPPQAANADPDG
ncbi:MAG: SPOR domain-containing protein [Rhodovibrio sp.]|nr:SPOR domain-containing protein [Rhodovibrio sp.]